MISIKGLECHLITPRRPDTRQILLYFIKDLFVSLSIEIIEDRLLHQDSEEPDDLRVCPVWVSVPLVGGGVLHVGGQGHPAYLAPQSVVHPALTRTDWLPVWLLLAEPNPS